MVSFPQDPMLAKHVANLPEPSALPGGCVYEPKLDGYRALLFVTEEGCRVQSRRGHDITDEFRDVAEAAFEQLPAGLVVDGELVVRTRGAFDFGELQRRLARAGKQRIGQPAASFIAFDLLAAAGRDVRTTPLRVRRQLLETVMAGTSAPLELCPQTDDLDVAREWLGQFADAEQGMEGLVVKGADTTYRGGARGWLKYRLRDTVEAVVGGVGGSLDAPGHLVLGLPDADGRLFFAGTTTALTPAQRREVASAVSPAEAAHAWLPDSGASRWGGGDKQPVRPVRANLVVEVSVDSSVQEGRWRHPVKLVRLRPDLTPDEVAGQRG
ncbi:ATP-dependent DNA ligase [Aeromicrobium wangtongii]|uniref:ATP-dependent DNA ligase n=1 Tax=Aeromicrobium wangtongii TaxID=2969247 RepID=A0ABY5M4X3_9ACTN|nr:ATP-dependent DNA ligase [Aeromicrobium wangtongii]MCD9198734.1 ATP-dependent DNA ligase [Aeromicrobium wangtongii]UUP13219.1 ATP-dependent DNA ligase [Aeromicrobium wangtongii]